MKKMKNEKKKKRCGSTPSRVPLPILKKIMNIKKFLQARLRRRRGVPSPFSPFFHLVTASFLVLDIIPNISGKLNTVTAAKAKVRK